MVVVLRLGGMSGNVVPVVPVFVHTLGDVRCTSKGVIVGTEVNVVFGVDHVGEEVIGDGIVEVHQAMYVMASSIGVLFDRVHHFSVGLGKGLPLG